MAEKNNENISKILKVALAPIKAVAEEKKVLE